MNEIITINNEKYKYLFQKQKIICGLKDIKISNNIIITRLVVEGVIKERPSLARFFSDKAGHDGCLAHSVFGETFWPCNSRALSSPKLSRDKQH